MKWRILRILHTQYIWNLLKWMIELLGFSARLASDRSVYTVAVFTNHRWMSSKLKRGEFRLFTTFYLVFFFVPFYFDSLSLPWIVPEFYNVNRIISKKCCFTDFMWYFWFLIWNKFHSLSRSLCVFWQIVVWFFNFS